MANRTWLRSVLWLSVKSASRSSTTSGAPLDFAGPDHVHIKIAEDARVPSERLGKGRAFVDRFLDLGQDFFQARVRDLLGQRAPGNAQGAGPGADQGGRSWRVMTESSTTLTLSPRRDAPLCFPSSARRSQRFPSGRWTNFSIFGWRTWGCPRWNQAAGLFGPRVKTPILVDRHGRSVGKVFLGYAQDFVHQSHARGDFADGVLTQGGMPFFCALCRSLESARRLIIWRISSSIMSSS